MKKREKLTFQSKARNLLALQGLLKNGSVLPLLIISKCDLQDLHKGRESSESKKAIFAKIQALQSNRIIIRSSSLNEDSTIQSNAGAFLSIANIKSDDENAVFEALQKVADSMPNDNDEILIQPFLDNISACGVAFSVDKDNFAPYFCISFDESGSSNAITDGSSKVSKNFYAYRGAESIDDLRMSQLIAMIRECENLFDCKFLDIEFAFVRETQINKNPCGSILDEKSGLQSHEQGNKTDKRVASLPDLSLKDNAPKEKLFLLQVRPLVMQGKLNLFKALPKEALGRLYRRLENLKENRCGVLGENFIFGIMPDWNPAEIIGIRPKRLALSLYKAIITDNIWAYQRDNYGYRDLRSHPLMHSFLGMPYIDVRISFNSFVPKDLNAQIAEKLINFYLQKLIDSPHLHDKIEFAIVYSCYDFNSPHKLKKLLNYGFNENEIKRLEFALLNLTNDIINPKNALFRKDIAKAKNLSAIFTQIKDSNYSPIDKIYWLLESCKRYGTLPFAGVARAGFVAMQMLNSLVEIGFLSVSQKDDFLNSLNTISKVLSTKSANLNTQNADEFLSEFGHLRAGTYNILSPRYDCAFEKYFAFCQNPQTPKRKNFTLDSAKMQELDILLAQNGLKIDSQEFFSFLKDAIEGRERVKFEFSKLLSYAIELIGELGAYYGISKENMAHLDIQNIFTLYSSLYSKSPKERFLDEIARHKAEHNLTLALKLPPLLYSPRQIYSFFTQTSLPNFITQKSVTAQVAFENDKNLQGKIVLIKSADPGYDYLFAKNIAGLITCYGGANSHMAIRASELALPSVIGVGEEKFAQLCNAKRVRIECGSEQILCL